MIRIIVSALWGFLIAASLFKDNIFFTYYFIIVSIFLLFVIIVKWRIDKKNAV
jgi:hypothetical protein